MIVDVKAIAADEMTSLRAECLAMRVITGQLLASFATLCSNENRTASEFVDIFRREGTNLLLADSTFDAHPALEVLRAEAVNALAEFCDPIAKGLENYQPPSPSAAETSSGDKQ